MKIKHIHPFPARMAPEIALHKVQALSPGQTVLDPMAGSGMVLTQAVQNRINAIGVDLDPLAELISRVGTSPVDEGEIREGLKTLINCCLSITKQLHLPWIDDDAETTAFTDFWFAPQQKMQLRCLSYLLFINPIKLSKHAIDVIKVALSRLIITKNPKASLARDTAHSRPHKTIYENTFNVFEALPLSLEHIFLTLSSLQINAKVTTHLGDARNLVMIDNESIDCIITSPPYVNAIDYMRGHRLSLIWFGYRIQELRNIRSAAIGAENRQHTESYAEFNNIISEFDFDKLPSNKKHMLHRYFLDLKKQTAEAYRVLKNGSCVTYVIGNSTINGIYIKNSELLKRAATLAGFKILEEAEREIPNNHRYMPMTEEVGNSLAGRMRMEHVIDFKKTA